MECSLFTSIIFSWTTSQNNITYSSTPATPVARAEGPYFDPEFAKPHLPGATGPLTYRSYIRLVPAYGTPPKGLRPLLKKSGLGRSLPLRDLARQLHAASHPRPYLRGGGMRDAVDVLTPTTHRDTITAPLLESLAPTFRGALDQYPWAIPQNLQPFLQQCGIDSSGFGFKAHPHPVHKTIETHLLFDVWANLATTPSSVMFMKPSKFTKLRRKQGNFHNLHNYRLTPKDTIRYPETSPHLPDTESVFMHDALMYFSPGQILNLFESQPNLQKLYASLVVPPESSFTDQSLHPELYRFRFDGDQLVYELEGNPAHNYAQPREALAWLETTTIVGPDFSLSVSRLDSWGPVHSMLIQRGEAPLHQRYSRASFRGPEAVCLPSPASLHQDLRHRLVPKKVYDAIFMYVRAVRTLRVTDPAGFVRTQCSKPEYSWVTSSAWDNLQHFALTTASHRPRTTFHLFTSAFARCTHWIMTHGLGIRTAVTLPIAGLSGASCWLFHRLITGHVDQCAILGRWVKVPFGMSKLPRIALPPAPWFSLQTHAGGAGIKLLRGTRFEFQLFNQLFRSWARNPWLAQFLPRRRMGKLGWSFLLTSIMAPILSLAARKFLGPDSPQSLHDSYHAMFHPEPWTLTLDQGPVFCTSTPFLPVPTVPTPAAASFPDNPPLPVSEVSPQIPLQAVSPPSPPQPDSSPTPEPVPVPASTPPPPPELSEPAPPPAVEAPQAPAPPADPSDVPAQPAPVEFSFPDPPAETHVASMFGVPTPLDGKPAAPNTPLTVEERGHVYTTAPLPEPETPAASDPLGSDPSASGPIAFFRELYPASWLQNSGLFLCRSRNSSRSSHPYPSNDCLLAAVSEATSIPRETLWETLITTLPDCLLDSSEIRVHGLSTDHFCVLALMHSLRARFISEGIDAELGLENAVHTFTINHFPGKDGSIGHFALKTPAHASKLNGGLADDLAAAALRFRTKGGHFLPFREAHYYKSSPARAKNLISNMKNGFDGVMANVDPGHAQEARTRILSLDGVMDISCPRNVRLVHLAGFAGCGKSWPIAQLLKTPNFRNFKVAVPTVELRTEWKELLSSPPSERWRVGTWESSLLKSARVLVIDEVYKMPRGYLDLAIHSDSSVEFVFALGDPLQGEYHSTHPSSSNPRLPSEISHLRRYIDFYCFWSHRIPRNVAQCLGVPTTSKLEGFATYTQHFPTNTKILCNSMSACKTLQQCGYDSVTIASSQGSTYSGPACVHLDRNSRLLSASHSLVAITRSKAGVIFTGDRQLLDGTPSSNAMFSALFAGKPYSAAGQLSELFPPCPRISEPITSRRTLLKGAASHASLPQPSRPASHRIPSRPHFEEDPYSLALPIRDRFSSAITPDFRGDVVIDHSHPVSGDGSANSPQISTHFLPETRRPLHLDIASAIPSSADRPSSTDPTDTAFEPVYPGETFENLAAHFLPAHDPEDKEIYFKGQLSSQFPHLNRDWSLSCQPSSLLAAIHSSKQDPTLLPASIAKRLRFRPSSKPYQITAKDQVLGQLLFEGLCRAYRRNPSSTETFDETLFIECINLNEFAQLTSKTQSVIMANASRSDPDWRWSAVRIFSKSQHKVNEGSIFGPWKACQTLALMHDAIILLLGPVKKYQRVLDQRDRPAHLYIHAGHTPFEMLKWCQAHLSSAVHLANDYTAFDQSQHGEAVVLEALKMRRAGIPEHFIHLHCQLKTTVETQFGPLTCMRLTGEPGTYDDNSDYNLAVLHLEYCMGDTPVMISGDDSLLDSEPPSRPEWSVVEPLLALRFKKERGRYATFCGYYVGSAGAVRSPIALFAKLAIAVDDLSIEDKLTSYLTEFSVGHSLGDSMWNCLPLDAVPYQSACFDFFCRHAPAHLKLSLRLGEVDESIMRRAFQHIKWATHAVYALLSAQDRRQILNSSRQSRSMPEDPEVAQLQAELGYFHLSGGSDGPSNPAPHRTPCGPGQVIFPSAGSPSGSPHHTLDCSTFSNCHMSDSLLPELYLSGGALNTPPALSPSPSLLFMASTPSDVGPPPQSDDRRDHQPRLPAPSRVVEALAPIYIDYPFQWKVGTYTGAADVFVTDDLSGSATLKTITNGYRHAELISVEAEFSPLAASFGKPITFSVVWTVADVAPATLTETAYYGGRIITIGGPVLMSSTTSVPADLSRLNAVIKASVSYRDTPRLSYTACSCGGSANTNLAQVTLRGVVRLSGPTGNKLA
ncbi:polyprotein [Camellia-associated marafivirus]|nr:polyprotein [Camellia-associated marafivirus]